MHFDDRFNVSNMLWAAGFFSGFVSLRESLEEFIGFCHQSPVRPDSVNRDGFQIRPR
ncbi:hypothetical protein AGR6A_pTi0083 [Agrobacterium sp. NCPPB 925]|nr:hypothetical protein AGR6A_pTi0083 [Agrobacterium sp. NCPPB 925]